jgi:O-antigen/teichoic acid export membrane protein
MNFFKNTTIFHNAGFKTAKSIVALFFVDAISLVALVVFPIVVGRILGREALGIFSFSIAVAALARIVIEAGYDITIPRSVSTDFLKAPALFREAQLLKHFLWLIVFPLGILSVVFLKDVRTILCVAIFMLWLVPRSYNSTCLATLRGLNYIRLGAKIESVSTAYTYIVAAGVVILFKNIVVAVFIIALGEFLKTLWFNAALRDTFQNKSLPELPEYFSLWNSSEAFKTNIREQFRLGTVNILSTLQSRSATFALAGSTIALGEYSAAMRFLTAARTLPGAVMNVLLPKFSKENSVGGISPAALFKTIFAATIAGSIISGVLWLLAPWLMLGIFGFKNSVVPLQILAWSFVFVLNNHIFEAYLLAIHKERSVSWLLGISSAAIFAAIFVFKSNALIAAWATLGGEMLLSVLYVILVLFKREKR